MKRPTRILVRLLIVGLLAALVSSTVLADDDYEPAYGSAMVDGVIDEWDLDADLFAEMYRAANPDKPIESKLYLRYDCDTGTLYALVLAEDGVVVLPMEDDAFIKYGPGGVTPPKPNQWDKLVDGAGDGVAGAEFAWVPDTDGLLGWEASAPLAEGSYWINVHTQVFDEEQQTSAVRDRAIPLALTCNGNAVKLASFDAAPSRGTVTLNWEMATEIDTAGFNLYRARSESGAWTKVNDNLIAATGTASYSYMDKPGYGAFLYKLEEVTNDGATTLYDLIMVKVAPLFRRPSRRPMPPRVR